MQEDKYRLEYSSKEGVFHYEDTDNNNKNTNGYVCLCDNITLNQCDEFTNEMFEKYPNINTGNNKGYPTIKMMKIEFKSFLLT